MRGERDPSILSNYRPGLRTDGTPSTPSTASTTVRQNPLLYQRMHSNESDKDGSGIGTAAGKQSD